MLLIHTIETPLGKMTACADEKGICLLEFSDKATLVQSLSAIQSLWRSELAEGKSPYFSLLEAELEEYFAGRLREFSVPLSLAGTDFQREVWAALQTIPYGCTISYQQQALNIGRPQAVRAVANANGQNRISILLPCHRVIGRNGRLTGYGGGLWRKEKLLQLEKAVLF
ncbi:methylated-DNA--[protein]-cysteine S-methyltransferase [Bergeyella sp. RCAD1439]|uniref:methylated-DNA--[protein]-cysteine S-methyltransferase n=1 Tax=Bergeyella anatis TaxID=3113737 RepID=UPI002E19DBFD|nr:methylated-DNA--[protein]-cysteine S-methyltransferase [Bergeyella sp. RCAD1439]